VWWENKNMSMAYAHGYKCAKNCCKWTILVHLIVKNVVTFFLRHTVDFRVTELLYTVSQKQ